MRYNNSKLGFDIYRADISDELGGTNSLNVDTDMLLTYGKKLISAKETMDILLDVLDSLMGGITSGWGDKDGADLVSGFSEFVASAKEIGVETEKLGRFAVREASKYNTILSTSLRMMSGGGGN